MLSILTNVYLKYNIVRIIYQYSSLSCSMRSPMAVRVLSILICNNVIRA